MEGATKSRAPLTADNESRTASNFADSPDFPVPECEAGAMKLEVRIGGLVRQIEIQSTGPNQFAISGEDRGGNDTKIKDRTIDAVEVAPNTYSILVNGRAFEAVMMPAAEGVQVRCGGQEFHAIVSDPRAWRRRQAALFGSEGKQQITAPMPGKVIRVLVSAGEKVQTDQGLVVIEAMKMQNEIRAPKAGTIERIFIREGDAVAAGEPLLTIE